MIRLKNARIVENNAIVIEWRDNESMNSLRQGKRVAKNFPMSREARRVYVKHGPISCVKQIMKEYPENPSIAGAYGLLKLCRGDSITPYQAKALLDMRIPLNHRWLERLRAAVE